MKLDKPAEPDFTVKVTPFEREGSNILGLARIYFADSFVVSKRTAFGTGRWEK